MFCNIERFIFQKGAKKENGGWFRISYSRENKFDTYSRDVVIRVARVFPRVFADLD